MAFNCWEQTVGKERAERWFHRTPLGCPAISAGLDGEVFLERKVSANLSKDVLCGCWARPTLCSTLTSGLPAGLPRNAG